MVALVRPVALRVCHGRSRTHDRESHERRVSTVCEQQKAVESYLLEIQLVHAVLPTVRE